MEQTTSIPIRLLYEYFDFTQLTGDEASLERKILLADTNRPGLELAGYFNHSQSKRLVVLGDKEISYIETMSDNKCRKAFQFLTDDVTPAIIITKGHDCPSILERIAKRKNFPIFMSTSPTTRLIVDIVAFLDEQLAVSTSIHGGLLSIFGKGVLIRGESGMGKSEIALELIRRGHTLIADDRVDCYRIHNKLLGRAPELLQEMLEIRGIGIINVKQMFGVAAFEKQHSVDFEIVLENWSTSNTFDRVGMGVRPTESILGIDIPKIVIPVREGRSMAVIIESAIMNSLLFDSGYDSGQDFEDRVIAQIGVNREKGGK